MVTCQNLLIRFTIASFTSPTADASVCTAKKLISARSSQDKPWGSKKSKKVLGWSALWSTISATSIWRKKLCSLSTTLLAQKCNLCLRYDLSPMSPGRTRFKVVRPGGLELPTFWFVARRSIQLSYGRTVHCLLSIAYCSFLFGFNLKCLCIRGFERYVWGKLASISEKNPSRARPFLFSCPPSPDGCLPLHRHERQCLGGA